MEYEYHSNLWLVSSTGLYPATVDILVEILRLSHWNNENGQTGTNKIVTLQREIV